MQAAQHDSARLWKRVATGQNDAIGNQVRCLAAAYKAFPTPKLNALQVVLVESRTCNRLDSAVVPEHLNGLLIIDLCHGYTIDFDSPAFGLAGV
ncbi:MAG: hypothetical protein AAF078_04100 [Planctomycetota bacterium]